MDNWIAAVAVKSSPSKGCGMRDSFNYRAQRDQGKRAALHKSMNKRQRAAAEAGAERERCTLHLGNSCIVRRHPTCTAAKKEVWSLDTFANDG